ncbi:MAG: zinc finger HIT domain-containing protein [Halobacteriaceae archaeon]
MSVDSLCQICQAARADYRCDRCGTMVCEAHFDRDRQRCAACLADTESAP